MATQFDKGHVLRTLYYEEDRFDGILANYRKADKVLNTITVACVKAWIDQHKARQVKPYRQFNSYVAPKGVI